MKSNIDWEYKLEQYGPIALGVIGVALLFVFSYQVDDEKVGKIYEAAINISAIIIGFLTTMSSVLITTNKASVLENINRAKKLSTLMRYFHEVIGAGFLVVILSLVLMSKELLCVWAVYIYIGILVYFLFATVRISIVLLRIFENIMIENTGKEQNKTYKPHLNEKDIRENIRRNREEDE